MTDKVEVKEIKHGPLASIITEGAKHIVILHTYKSVIPELIQVKSDSENKKELYNENFSKLQPCIQKMRDVCTWNDQSQKDLINFFQKILDKVDTEPINDELAEEIILSLDVMLAVDYLKTWQAGLNNDFSMYRRAVQHVKKDYNMESDESLRTFLVTPNNIIRSLKKEVEKLKDNYKIFMTVVKKAVDRYQKTQQDLYLRVIAFSLFLMDREFTNPANVGPIKKMTKLSAVEQLIEEHPKVTLYKDLSFNIENFKKNFPNFFENTEDDGCCLIM
jgi:hypothetical protein